MKYIDFHCDTLCIALSQNKEDLTALDKTMVNLEKLKIGGCMAQFFAIFMLPEQGWEAFTAAVPDDDTYIAALRQILHETAQRCPEYFALAHNARELEENERQGKLSAFLTLEDGRAVQGSLERLENFYTMGIRLISLTHNKANCLGFPNSPDFQQMQRGLTDFGKDAVRRMNELGMLVDVSHLSDGGFWDVVKVSKAPFIASHSNCRSIGPHPRNLTDAMIHALADHGGVAGLNFYPAFLDWDTQSQQSRAALIARQARYMADQGGIGCVALGTDFDGMEGNLEIDGPDKLYLLWDALKKEGFGEDDIERIAWKNAKRLLQDVLK